MKHYGIKKLTAAVLLFTFLYTFFSTMSSSVFTNLLAQYKSWSSLSEFLTSDAGGSLRVYDRSTPENPFALIRYVKGKSNLTLPHVRAFRSVVWDTLENRPVSVSCFKSEDGESLPSKEGSTEGYSIERFLDGVMIGGFWDKYTGKWRIHTRSTLDATSRYYRPDLTFRDMFMEYVDKVNPLLWTTLDKNCSYTWVLQHSANRVVVPVTQVNATIVQKTLIDSSGNVTFDNANDLKINIPMPTWQSVEACLSDWNNRYKYQVQGIVVKNAEGKRWKIRTSEYNRVRHIRSNTARRDYLWLTLWRSNGLKQYLALFPEERTLCDGVISRWKRITNDVFHIYTDVFKARSLDKKTIPPKYRPFVYGLHSQYMETLKPAGKSVSWKSALDYMNGRDVAQMLFAINWEARMAMKQMGAPSVPLEPPVSVGSEVQATEPEVIFQRSVTDEDTDMPDLVPVSATVDSVVL